MEIDYSPYNFEKIDSEEYIYLFDTDFGLSNEVVFKATPYLFSPDKPYSNDTYEFSIIVIENPKHASPPFDNRIGGTIAQIFNDFYRINGNTISLYICASHDNRHQVRFRKFNAWFTTFHDSKYFKIDSPITNSKGNNFPISIILRFDNPFAQEIADSFIELIQTYQK
jgi:Family of unknown function (DUF6169)